MHSLLRSDPQRRAGICQYEAETIGAALMTDGSKGVVLQQVIDGDRLFAR